MQAYRQGERVENKSTVPGRWKTGYVAMVIPAGVSPVAMYNRYLRGHGEIRFRGENPVMHCEKYIIAVSESGKTRFHCCGWRMLRRAGE